MHLEETKVEKTLYALCMMVTEYAKPVRKNKRLVCVKADGNETLEYAFYTLQDNGLNLNEDDMSIDWDELLEFMDKIVESVEGTDD